MCVCACTRKCVCVCLFVCLFVCLCVCAHRGVQGLGFRVICVFRVSEIPGFRSRRLIFMSMPCIPVE